MSKQGTDCGGSNGIVKGGPNRSITFTLAGRQLAALSPEAYARPSLAVARFLIAQGQLIEELALATLRAEGEGSK